MDRLVIYRGVFGGWGWERLDGQGEVTAESAYHFDDRAECVADAAARGFDPRAESMVPSALEEAAVA